MPTPECPNPHAAIVAARFGHSRFCDLCNPEHPDFSPSYVTLVEQLSLAPATIGSSAVSAAGNHTQLTQFTPVIESTTTNTMTDESPITAGTPTRELHTLVLQCPYRGHLDCNCQGAKCWADYGQAGRVSFLDCYACMSQISRPGPPVEFP